MDITIENRVPFTDVATICTENQFWKLAESDSDLLKKDYVSVVPILLRGGTCARSWSDGLPQGHVAVFSEKLNSYYISFLLNTAPCQAELFAGKINALTKVRVNKKKLSTLKIPVPDKDSQKIYAIAETLFEGMIDIDKEDERLQYVFKVLESLCNCLAIDLFMHPTLREKGLTLFDDWAKVAIEYNEQKDFKVVMNALTDSDSPLRNDIMKFFLLLDK